MVTLLSVCWRPLIWYRCPPFVCVVALLNGGVVCAVMPRRLVGSGTLHCPVPLCIVPLLSYCPVPLLLLCVCYGWGSVVVHGGGTVSRPAILFPRSSCVFAVTALLV